MKTLQPFLVTLLMIVMSSGLFAQDEMLSRVKIYASRDKEKRSELIGQLEIDHFIQTEDGAIISEIEPSALRKLAMMGAKYEVLVPDVGAALRKENERFAEALKAGVDPESYGRSAFDETGKTIDQIIQTPSAFTVNPSSFGGYLSFAQMNTAMNNLVAAYPSLASKTSIGTTHLGNDIWVIKISDNVTTDEANEPEILYFGLQHAREAIGGSSMIFFIQYLCERYMAGDEKIQQLVNNREFFIIPCLNPDGWEWNRTHGGVGSTWRKNRRNNPGTGNSEGVDLNRNWGIDWAECDEPILGNPGSCGSGSYSSATYWGPSVFSEPETQAVRDFVYTRHFVAAIDQHAFGPYYSLPFGRPSLHPGADSLNLMDQQFYQQISSLMGTYNGMRAGNSYQSVGYEVAGGVKDWFLKGDIGVGTKGKIYGLTGEGNGGGGTFWPPSSQIIRLCKGMVFQNLQLAYAAGSYVDIQDQGNLGVNEKWGDLNFKLTRIGIADEAVTISLIPIENVVTVGDPVTINSLPDYYDTYTGGISFTLPWTMNNGQRFKYAWKVETGGYIYYDTVTKFYNPQQLFYDNMESNFSSKWDTDADWNYTTDNAFEGSRSLHESPGGVYEDEREDIVTYTGTFNLADATQSWLTFMTRHRSENFYDKLQVQVSTNGSDWEAVVGSTTVQEPGTLDGSTIDGQPSLTGVRDIWTKELFDLSEYNGASNLRLRFVFSSGEQSDFFYNVDDGFYIDNLQMIKSSVPMAILPVKFISFKGELLADRTIKLEWEAETDVMHDHFEVERSANGQVFTPLGKVAGAGPYHFVDKWPLSGNNYYRVKQYDKNGNFYYSKVINVKNDYKAGLSIYPNPLTGDVLTIKVEDPRLKSVRIQVTDVSGRQVYQSDRDLQVAAGEIKVNTSSWSAQLYLLRVTSLSGELIAVQKFLKQ